MRVSDYDIILEILLINRSETSTLTNVSVELSTMGDLRLVERPPSFTLGPKDSKTIKANVKVSSTETGHIFGTITYDAVGPSVTGDRSAVINLAEIHVDIMDYIHPAVCRCVHACAPPRPALRGMRAACMRARARTPRPPTPPPHRHATGCTATCHWLPLLQRLRLPVDVGGLRVGEQGERLHWHH